MLRNASARCFNPGARIPSDDTDPSQTVVTPRLTASKPAGTYRLAPSTTAGVATDTPLATAPATRPMPSPATFNALSTVPAPDVTAYPARDPSSTARSAARDVAATAAASSASVAPAAMARWSRCAASVASAARLVAAAAAAIAFAAAACARAASPSAATTRGSRASSGITANASMSSRTAVLSFVGTTAMSAPEGPPISASAASYDSSALTRKSSASSASTSDFGKDTPPGDASMASTGSVAATDATGLFVANPTPAPVELSTSLSPSHVSLSLGGNAGAEDRAPDAPVAAAAIADPPALAETCAISRFLDIAASSSSCLAMFLASAAPRLASSLTKRFFSERLRMDRMSITVTKLTPTRVPNAARRPPSAAADQSFVCDTAQEASATMDSGSSGPGAFPPDPSEEE